MEQICTNLELRIYIIGDAGVGKKAIAKRFEILNSTATYENEYFIKLPPKAPLPSKSQKMKPPLPEHVLSFEERELRLKETKRLKYMTISKEFNIGKQTINLNFFPIRKAEPIQHDNEVREEDEDFDFEKHSKLSLKNIKQEIEALISRPPKSPTGIWEHFFMFVFDLSSFVSFEKIILYYSEWNKQFNLASNYQMILIGNKLDEKNWLSDDEKQNFEKFLDKTNIRYHEISTHMFFNFENFFEMLFSEFFCKLNPEFEKETFKNRLHLLLSLRPNFARAARSSFTFDENPSPVEYKTDIYTIPVTKAEMKQVYSNRKTRFKNHIFINKQGPWYPIINKDKFEWYTKEKNAKGSTNKDVTNVNFTSMNDVSKKELKEVWGEKLPGFSCGIKPGKLLLKESRRDLKKRQNLWLDDAWDDDTVIKLHIKIPPKIKENEEYEKYSKLKQENLDSKRLQMISSENAVNMVHSEILKSQEKERNIKIQKIQEKEEKYNRIFDETQRSRSQSKQQSSAKTNRALLPISTTPGPNAYDIRGDLILKRNFTLRHRFPESKRNEQVPQFHDFRNEFEDIVKRGLKWDHDRWGKKFGERFPEPKIFYPEEPRQIYEKWEHWENNKRSCNKVNDMLDFIDKRKKRSEKAYYTNLELEEKHRMEIEQKIAQQFGEDQKTTYMIRDINYGLIEDQSPKFSIKGRYEHGGIFDLVGGKEEKPNRMNNLQAQASKTWTDKPPDFNKVRPSLPQYSFGKSSRFNEDNSVEESAPIGQKERLFVTGEFKPSDYRSYLVKEVTMGTAEKGSQVKDNGVPGPGWYKLKGFAEEIAEKGAIINEVRTAIREKEKNKIVEGSRVESGEERDVNDVRKSEGNEDEVSTW